jgi:integrase
MHRVDAWRMIQRRSAELGTRVKIGCHTFRATGITAYLEAGGTLENAQAMAAHESPRTTKLYDRTGDEITPKSPVTCRPSRDAHACPARR